MACYLCGSKNFVKILEKKSIYIWANTDEDGANRKKHPCVINQCCDCGHIYQPLDDKLEGVLDSIYSSKNAAGITPMGKGNWGLERTRNFLGKINLRGYKSALEIGCADGYILRYLKDMGFCRLAGIDPSFSETREQDGILFLKDNTGEKLKINQKFDLIFSNAVFEHIEDINSVIKFCRNNLNEDGELYFCVPNAQKQLKDIDLGLFIHEHLHYFTERSLEYLLSRNQFKVNSIISAKDSLNVSAKISRKSLDSEVFTEIVFYRDYQEKMERLLIEIERILREKKLIVHGANGALNNILGWLDKKFDFVLVDNDINKQAKKYFNRVVKPLPGIRLSDYNTLLIVPVSFYEEIRDEYIRRGFTGVIKGVTAKYLRQDSEVRVNAG